MKPDPIETSAARPPERLRIRPTRYGFIFIVVLAAMLLGSINYNNNLGFLLTFLLSGMAMVSILHTYRNIADIRVLSLHAEPVFAGEPALFTCRASAAKKASVAVAFAFGSARPVTVDVDSADEEPVQIPMGTPTRRGVMHPGPLTAESDYPFGLFRARKNLVVDGHVLVYPQPLFGPLITAGGKRTSGISGKKSARGVDDFQGLKPYQPGDRLQHISWKAYSRGQGLFTKQFGGESGASEMFDWDALAETDTERRLSRLCDMVLTADRQRLSYGLRLPERTLRPNRGEVHKKNCLKALALHGRS